MGGGTTEHRWRSKLDNDGATRNGRRSLVHYDQRRSRIRGSPGLPRGRLRSLVLRSRDQGGTWETADGYQLANGSSETEGLAADSRGYLYAISFGTDSSYQQHWQVRRSTDGGDAWATVDDYTGNGGGSPMQ